MSEIETTITMTTRKPNRVNLPQHITITAKHPRHVPVAFSTSRPD
jgi:hypothetical protein